MSLFSYIRETKGELKHVAWPTRKQAVVFTAVVIIISVGLSLYLGLADFVFSKGLIFLIQHSK